ncbi:MAG: TatD family hydrolase [Gammaproteobacteria bacterium]
MLVDSHCHLDRLDLTPFNGELGGALENAQQHGVGHMLCVCIDLEHFADVLAPARHYDNIYASVGVHPNEQEGQEPDVDTLVEMADDPRVIAIGETGLDYFRSEGDLEWQRNRFRTHIAAARQSGKPLIIHMREATADTLRIMQEEGAGEVGGVMHCFAEDWETAKAALDLDFYISFSGIVTFKSAKTLQDVAKQVPLERMLVETDSPYLAPTPFRGKSNQPAFVKYVAEHIAPVRGTSLEKIGEATTQNFFRLFRAANA